jgi:hypothetical protein
MELDLELDAWRREWQNASVWPADVQQRVERETRWMRRAVAAEIFITAVFGGGSLAWAALSGRLDVFVLAAGIWVFIAVAWTIALLMRRGAWTPAAATTTAFLELSILRCRRRREAVIAQAALYIMILAFDLAWIYAAQAEHTPLDPVTFLTSGGVAWVWAITALLAAAALWHRRRLGRELENLTALRRQLEG